jgi:protein-disulfide isomerase
MNKLPPVGLFLGGIAVGAIATTLAFTLNNPKNKSDWESRDPMPGRMFAAGQPLFSLAGREVALKDLPLSIQADLGRIQEQAFAQLNTYLKEVALRSLLAQEQGRSTREIPTLLSLLGDDTVSERDVDALLEAQKKNFPKDMNLKDIRKQIEMFLKQQKVGDAKEKKLAEAENAGKIKILLTAPSAQAIDTSTFPFQGASKAKTNVAVVTDFLSVQSRNMSAELDKVISEHSDKARFARIIFTWDPDGLGGTLARGAFCAQQQGAEQYWKYHSEAEKIAGQEPPVTSSDLQKEFNNTAMSVAKNAGLEPSAFEKCLNSQQAKDFVLRTSSALVGVGISNTPAFIVNGRMVNAAPQQLTQLIKNSSQSERK